MAHDFGFIGLGTMGRPMALRLLEAGYTLIAHDQRESAVDELVQRGASAAGSVEEVSRMAPVVFLSLPMPEVVRKVISGPGGLAESAGSEIVVDLSTTGTQVALEMREVLSAAGKTLVDCPISGGAEGAAAGTLALMLAGPEQAVERLETPLRNLGKVFRVGDAAGQGQTMKVINNLLSTAALTITAEAMVLGSKAGLDPHAMLDVLNAGSGQNSSTSSKFPKHVLTRSFDFGMPIALSAKDARLCLDEAERLGVPMIVGNSVRQMLTLTRDHLGPEVDMTCVVNVVEEWAKHEIGEITR
ncbi:NAD(P)-dependent oxidoreductase [Halomonas sp. TRM85114]|uniref:NAD(P)-dependent oxidoreductase n=1 Tax=Halomonas jincaotanensis TaxID=2810616 RepID=UPI001BD35B8E|nr:NAD(P)-dependent oxidoreductase [Halomonas jincaotanensis]MBS9403663.1 NAD(P)-dependent oxidoreductase [Halomonas jincaotanensis]